MSTHSRSNSIKRLSGAEDPLRLRLVSGAEDPLRLHLARDPTAAHRPHAHGGEPVLLLAQCQGPDATGPALQPPSCPSSSGPCFPAGAGPNPALGGKIEAPQ